MKKLLLQEGRALVLVAHPDDETIWMGGVMLMNPNISWTIFSVCRGDDVDRAPKFKRVCRQYGAKSIITNIEDDGIMNIQKSVPKIERVITKHLSNKKYRYIFTHDANGEYGHPRHKGVYRAVIRLVKKKKLHTETLYHFSYFLNEKKGYAQTLKNAQFFVPVSKTAFMKKRNIIQNAYGFSKNSFEYKSCASREGLRIR